VVGFVLACSATDNRKIEMKPFVQQHIYKNAKEIAHAKTMVGEKTGVNIPEGS